LSRCDPERVVAQLTVKIEDLKGPVEERIGAERQQKGHFEGWFQFLTATAATAVPAP